MTNCPVSTEEEKAFDVIYRIDESDVPPIRQWYTRILYNAYPPFRLNFVVDTHVFPCDRDAVRELFELFDASGVDVSVGNRVNVRSVMGAGALFRNSQNSRNFWLYAYRWMKQHNCRDDQAGIFNAIQNNKKNGAVKFKWLSFNWMFASHGITPQGKFSGPAKCYRTSLVVNGPVRFIHGYNQCQLMNGKNREHIWKPRVPFFSFQCNTAKKGIVLAFSENELRSFVNPYRIPNLKWNTFAKYNSTSLFWPETPF